MSVVVWDGDTLAADKRMTDQFGLISTVTKIFPDAGEYAVGVCGKSQDVQSVVDAIKNGTTIDEKFGESTAIAVHRKTGKVFVLTYGSLVPVEDPVVAIGAGREFACAFIRVCRELNIRHTSREAVLFASRYISTCGNGVDVWRFGEG